MQTHADAHRRMQMNADARRRTQTNADERRQMQTNARQTVSGVWADATSRRVQTLDICSRTFGMYYRVVSCMPEYGCQLHVVVMHVKEISFTKGVVGPSSGSGWQIMLHIYLHMLGTTTVKYLLSAHGRVT